MFRLIRVAAAFTFTTTTPVALAAARGLLRMRVRVLAVLVVATLAGPLLAVASATGASATWEQVGVPKGGACPDVLVIGARGSGQQPQQNGGVDPADYASDPYDGMGIETYTVYQRLAETHPQLHIAYEGVQYAAEPVLSTTQPSILSSPSGFIGNAKAGGTWLAQEVGLVDAECQHHTKFVLSGFSQGAWAVHRALLAMSSTLRKQVAGVVLFGDPLYVAHSTINRANNAINTFNGVAFTVDGGSAAVPKDIVPRTADYCNTFDPVCQFWSTNLLTWTEHLTYVPNGAAVQGADFISGYLPAPTPWTTITSSNPPNGAQNKAYSFTFKAANGVGTVTWSKSGTLPPGLQLTGAKLTGKPTYPGYYTFKIKATDAIGRSDTGSYSVNIDYDLSNPTPPPPPPPPLTCASTTITCTAGWGYDYYGELGDGTVYGSASLPAKGQLLDSATSLAEGWGHTLAIMPDGTVQAIGYNQDGELGNGTQADSSTPVPVSGLTDVTAVAAGRRYSLALKSDGTVWAWGYSDGGGMGIGGFGYQTSVPQQVPGLPGVKAISADADGSTSVALLNDGTVWGFGYPFGYSPVQISGLSNVVAITNAEGNVLALKSDGTVWAVGDNQHGELGNGTTTSSTTPVQVQGLDNVTQISAEGYNAYALKGDGTVWAWGNNQFGQLGDGTNTDSSIPVQVAGLTNVKSIAAGASHVLALRTDGTVWAWGYNWAGELGNGTTTSSNVPVKVLGLTGVKYVEAGGSSSLAFYN
jgi:alpha-tubulin suppressor-like RCC1 family protein